MGEIVWGPKPEQVKDSAMWKLRQKIAETHIFPDETYHSLHRWSVDNYQEFWQLVLEESQIVLHQPAEVVLENSTMPGAKWFTGARLNFAENLLQGDNHNVAIVFANESGVVSSMTYETLRAEVGRIQQGLKASGVGVGDRVAGFMPNIPETVVAMLATVGLGAIWSSCSPDFGLSGVLDRFSQINPKVLFGADQVLYNGKWHNNLEKLNEIKQSLKSVEELVVCPYPGGHQQDLAERTLWQDFGVAASPHFESLPFDHPLYIMYSSGTTGVPKCIVHGAGGTLLAHVKEHWLHGNLSSADTLFYYTTCGWMMWNWLVSGLSQGSTIVLYDGSPLQPDPGILFRISEETGVTHFGTSPKFISSVMKMNYSPRENHDISTLRTIYSTGAPLLPEHFLWVYENWNPHVQLASISGGTDIVGCFMLGNPLMNVRVGEIQAPGLGLNVQAWDHNRNSLLSEKGELVCTNPFPNMPIGFWNDENDEKYARAYFEKFPGVWWHGDFIEITANGGIVVYGRSDATLNPGGVRIGTAEIYRQVESFSWVKDSLVIGVPKEDDIEICLYVVVDGKLTEQREQQIRQQIRQGASPRHVPTKIFSVPDIPRTLSGKKVEKAVLNQVTGQEVLNREALANPEALDAFTHLC